MINKIKEKFQKEHEKILWKQYKNCSGKGGYCMGFFMYLLVRASKEVADGKDHKEAWAELLKFQEELLKEGKMEQLKIHKDTIDVCERFHLRDIVNHNGQSYYVSTCETYDRGLETMVFEITKPYEDFHEVGTVEDNNFPLRGEDVNWSEIYARLHHSKGQARRVHIQVVGALKKNGDPRKNLFKTKI